MEVIFQKKNKDFTPYNRIEICSQDAAACGVRKFSRVLLKYASKSAVGIVYINDAVPSGYFQATVNIINALFPDYSENTRYSTSIEPIPHMEINCVCRINNLTTKDPIMMVNEKYYAQIQSWKGRYCKVINMATGSMYLIEKNRIGIQKGYHDGQLGAARLIRKFLGIDEEKPAKSFSTDIELTPLTEEKSTFRDRLIASNNRFFSLFIGNSSLQLKCIRPNESDEDADIIRLSASNLVRLGIEEGDNAYICYKGKWKSVKVLLADRYEQDKNNKFEASANESFSADENFYVGIPRLIRKQLSINGMRYPVRVVRNCPFLFKKKVLLSFTSVLGLFLSAEFLNIFRWKIGNFPIGIVLFVALIPLFIYIAMTKERLKVK